MNHITFLITFLAFFSHLTVNGQEAFADKLYCTDEDRAVFDRYLSVMTPKKDLPVGELVIETARFFLGTPYVAATLEKEPEGLVVNLREMDCITFVEYVFNLVRTLREPSPSFEGFCRNLLRSRYKDGMITGYTERLHYTSDWMYENERRGFLKDVTQETGGQPLPLQLSFMSTHPDSYKQLKGNSAGIRAIAEKEREISRRSYYYIPETDIDRLAGGMQNGDMVGFVTTTAGLDIAHTGIVYKEGEKLTFIHASSIAEKVIINEESMSAYTQRVKSNKGVVIVRPL
jgi:cell wall-associated NlpC family hydrolase